MVTASCMTVGMFAPRTCEEEVVVLVDLVIRDVYERPEEPPKVRIPDREFTAAHNQRSGSRDTNWEPPTVTELDERCPGARPLSSTADLKDHLGRVSTIQGEPLELARTSVAYGLGSDASRRSGDLSELEVPKGELTP